MLATIPSETETNRPPSELAAALTDLALEVLRKAGVVGDSIEMELELWRALTAGLEHEARRRRLQRVAADSPLDRVLAQVVQRATRDVAVSFAPAGVSPELNMRPRP